MIWYEDLIHNITIWGRERKITNPDKQVVKLLEECGELAHEICRNNYNSDELKDAIGDIQVVLIILSDMLDINYADTLDNAYKVIENRKGKTINGCFIKQED